MNQVAVLTLQGAGVPKAVHPVIISDDKELVLIDCGYPGSLPLLKQAAAEQGMELDRLTKIIITHHDYDHMGALAACKRAYPRVQVVAAREEAPYIAGEKKSLRLQQAEALYASLPEEQKALARGFQDRLAALEPATVDILVQDRDCFLWGGGIEIVATPGHMPGHISVYLKESKTLVTGDALVAEAGRLLFANPQYTLDMKLAWQSSRKFLDYDTARIVCYHGGIVTENIRAALLAM